MTIFVSWTCFTALPILAFRQQEQGTCRLASNGSRGIFHHRKQWSRAQHYGLFVHRDKRPWSVSSVWNLKVTVPRWLTKDLTNIIASLYHLCKVPLIAPFYFKGITELQDGLAEKEHPLPVPIPSVQSPLPEPHMLFWCNAEISIKQTSIHNPKSTIFKA